MFGERLRSLRQAQHFSQQKLADELNKKYHTTISKSMISRWESGKTDPQMSYVRLITDFYSLSPNYFVEDAHDSGSSSAVAPLTQEESEHIDTLRQLTPTRQKRVYTFTDHQLEEQKKVINFPKAQPETVEEEVKIIGTVSAGTGEYMYGDEVEGEDVTYNGPIPPHDYALRVDGDSMEPMFEDGQIIFVDKCDDCDVHSGQIVIADLNGDAFVKKIDIEHDSVRLVSLNPKYNPITVDSFDEFRIMGIVVL